MIQAEVFLKAIWEHPDDDVPRLVYADWLEQRGDPYGEFIRTQIELTRGGRDRHQELGLRQRERELLERFGAAWAEPVVRQGLTPWFRRGIPQAVDRAAPPHSQPPRRVQLLCPVRVGGLTIARELPFVVGVLADLSGDRREGRLPLHQRTFLSVDGTSFDTVLARTRPELHLEIPEGPAGRPLPRRLDLYFERLADFEPARLAERIPELRAVLPDRQHEAAKETAPARLAALDRQLSLQLATVLHHSNFQRLESTWQGLHYLVRQTTIGEDLKIRVLDVNKQELVQDLDPRRPLQQTALFQKIYQQEYGHLDGEPYGLLVADYEFSHHAEDIQLLRSIAGVAAAAHAPLLAGASPKLFQRECFTELPSPRELPAIFKGNEYAAWQSFRDSDDSRYVALTLPRVRARRPYGEDQAHVAEFQCEEFVDGNDHAKNLWMNAAWAYAARITDAFTRDGWFVRVRGVAAGGRVEDLPLGISPADDGSEIKKCPTELAISDRREFELSNLGFLPLLHSKTHDFAVFMGAQSCQRPKQYFDPAANVNAEHSAKFNFVLCVSRFAHYLKVMARDLLAAAVPVGECQSVLGEWLRQYSLPVEECERIVREPDDLCASDFHAGRPITQVSLALRHGPQKCGHEMTVTLGLFFRQEYEVPPALRLLLSVPGLT